MLGLRDISFSYPGDTRVLDHVDLTLEEGELVLVAGRTGVGKSTLLGLFNGLVPSFTGSSAGQAAVASPTGKAIFAAVPPVACCSIAASTSSLT